MSSPGPRRNEDLHRRLLDIWGNPPGLGSLTAVNHTNVGQRFIVTGLVFFLVGGLLSMVMRAQLAWPGNTDVDHELYHQLVTMHGTTMMFLFAVPIMEGFAVYLLPKMIGARDLPFPRLGAYGYWCYLFGGIFLYSSFLFGAAPDGGWFMYVPLNGKTFSPGMNADFWLLGVTLAEISAVAAAVEIIVAVLKTRAPGMRINHLPLLAWYMLVVAFMILFGFPPLILASVLLEVERTFGLVFYEVARGGDPLLWQHLFWIFGHPEVYIIFLPAAGIVSVVVATFAQRPFVGYSWVVMAVIATGFISFGLWVHHMYAVGIPLLALGFFSAASMAVAIPSGIQVFAWIANLHLGHARMRVPLLYVFGFLFIFVAGGLTGVMVALVPFDWQVHDSHFVVAHLHYVLFGGMVFPLLGGLYYWLPLVTGRGPSEPLSRAGFWTVFLGFNVTFGPMHLTGMLGMPRRVYTYSEGLGWEWLNLISTLGSFIISIGVLIVLVDLLLHFRFGTRRHNPWNASSLEWAVGHPVPPYNFVSVPAISSRDPLWDQPGLAEELAAGNGYLADASAGKRETLGTSAAGARAEQVIWLPNSSWIPLVAATFTGVIFVGILTGLYWLSILATTATAGTFLVWAWQAPYRHAPRVIDAGHGLRLPIQSACSHAPGRWGLLITLLADATVFGSLVFAFFYLGTVAPPWPPLEYQGGALSMPTLALALLVTSSGAVGWGKRGLLSGHPRRLRLGLLVAAPLSLLFLFLQWQWLSQQLPAPQQHAYPSLVWSLWAYQFIHLAIAWLMGGFALARSWSGDLTAERPLEAVIPALFWHYTVALAVIAYAITQLFPLLT